jgi:hypothetical protein
MSTVVEEILEARSIDIKAEHAASVSTIKTLSRSELEKLYLQLVQESYALEKALHIERSRRKYLETPPSLPLPKIAESVETTQTLDGGQLNGVAELQRQVEMLKHTLLQREKDMGIMEQTLTLHRRQAHVLHLQLTDKERGCLQLEREKRQNMEARNEAMDKCADYELKLQQGQASWYQTQQQCRELQRQLEEAREALRIQHVGHQQRLEENSKHSIEQQNLLNQSMDELIRGVSAKTHAIEVNKSPRPFPSTGNGCRISQSPSRPSAVSTASTSSAGNPSNSKDELQRRLSELKQENRKWREVAHQAQSQVTKMEKTIAAVHEEMAIIVHASHRNISDDEKLTAALSVSHEELQTTQREFALSQKELKNLATKYDIKERQCQSLEAQYNSSLQTMKESTKNQEESILQLQQNLLNSKHALQAMQQQFAVSQKDLDDLAVIYDIKEKQCESLEAQCISLQKMEDTIKNQHESILQLQQSLAEWALREREIVGREEEVERARVRTKQKEKHLDGCLAAARERLKNVSSHIQEERSSLEETFLANEGERYILEGSILEMRSELLDLKSRREVLSKEAGELTEKVRSLDCLFAEAAVLSAGESSILARRDYLQKAQEALAQDYEQFEQKSKKLVAAEAEYEADRLHLTEKQQRLKPLAIEAEAITAQETALQQRKDALQAQMAEQHGQEAQVREMEQDIRQRKEAVQTEEELLAALEPQLQDRKLGMEKDLQHCSEEYLDMKHHLSESLRLGQEELHMLEEQIAFRRKQNEHMAAHVRPSRHASFSGPSGHDGPLGGGLTSASASASPFSLHRSKLSSPPVDVFLPRSQSLSPSQEAFSFSFGAATSPTSSLSESRSMGSHPHATPIVCGKVRKAAIDPGASPQVMQYLQSMVATGRMPREEVDQWQLARSKTVAVVFSKIRHNRTEEVKNLLIKGVPANITDEFGNTMLHVACQNGRFNLAVFLVNEAALDVNAQNNNGNTPLHYCTAYHYVKLGAFLVSKGADSSIVNNRGIAASLCSDSAMMEDLPVSSPISSSTSEFNIPNIAGRESEEAKPSGNEAKVDSSHRNKVATTAADTDTDTETETEKEKDNDDHDDHDEEEKDKEVDEKKEETTTKTSNGSESENEERRDEVVVSSEDPAQSALPPAGDGQETPPTTG